jgi:signal transduction histidine kinase
VIQDQFPWAARRLALGETIAVADPADLPEMARGEFEFAADDPVQSFLAIPLEVGGAWVGALSVGSTKKGRTWSAQTISRLRLLGNLFANALHRKRLEEDAALHERELAHVGRRAALSELASALTRELGGPLSAIASNARAGLARGEGGGHEEPLDELLRDLDADATRAVALVRRLRDLRQPGALERRRLDVNQLVRGVEALARADARLAGAELSVECAEGLPPAQGDAIRLQQALLELVRTAAEVSVDGVVQRVVLRTSRAEDGAVELTVENVGPSIDAAALGELLAPTEEGARSGAGLALAITRRVAEDHGGSLVVERGAEGGLAVRLRLPSA